MNITCLLKLDGADAGCVIVDVATGDVAHHLGGDILTASQRALLPAGYTLTHRPQAFA